MGFLILCILIKGLLALTVTSPPDIDVSLGPEAVIVLNCSFEKGTDEYVVSITWSKENKAENKYRTLAKFFQSHSVYYDPDLKNRSSSATFKNGSNSAILNISVVKCEDEGKYKCTVEYLHDYGILLEMSTNTYVHIQVRAKTPVDFSLQPNSSLEENNVVNFSCFANIGHPEGKVKIWKHRYSAALPLELGESSSFDKQTANCSTTAHLTILYNLTKYDNGAVFWCTSHNRNTSQNPARSTEIGPLNILYGPSFVSIVLSPYNNVSFVGDRVRLTCASDGNPSPTYQWTVNFTEIIDGEKYRLSDQDETLEFSIDSVTDNSYYHCIASNSLNGKSRNMSGRILLNVQEKLSVRKSCLNLECPFFEKCTTKDNTALCSTDAWKIVAFLFITFSIVLGMTTASLWVYLKLRKQILDGIKIRDGEDRSYETLSSGITQMNLEERDYEVLDNGVTHTYSTINESTIRDGEERNYESLSSGETHIYTSITTPTVPM